MFHFNGFSKQIQLLWKVSIEMNWQNSVTSSAGKARAVSGVAHGGMVHNPPLSTHRHPHAFSRMFLKFITSRSLCACCGAERELYIRLSAWY